MHYDCRRTANGKFMFKDRAVSGIRLFTINSNAKSLNTYGRGPIKVITEKPALQLVRKDRIQE
jgi:hypothetical protein